MKITIRDIKVAIIGMIIGFIISLGVYNSPITFQIILARILETVVTSVVVILITTTMISIAIPVFRRMKNK
jgi:hypothetical protein